MSGITKKANTLLGIIEFYEIESEKSKIGIKKSISKKNLDDFIINIHKKRNINDIVELEKSILEHTLEKYGNSKAMKSSLSTAILELNIIQKHIKKVDDIEEYKHIDNSFKNPKNRQKNLPIDEAVQGFKGHIARLSNLDKANLSDDEKNLIKARIEAFKTAYNIYQQKQAKTLAVDL